MYKNPHGFTLIEILVSTAIFIIIMVMAMGALLSVSAANNKATSIKTVMDNLNFALSSMSRSIQTGITYHCGNGSSPPGLPTPTDCSTGGTYLVFQADASVQTGCTTGSTCVVTYCRGSTSGTPSCGSTGSYILRNIYNGSSNSGLIPITAAEVVIDKLTFYVKGAPLGDSIQPKTTIIISGHTQSGGTAPNTTFNVQTSVTQRLYDK